jgi:uncharacterized protein
MTTMERPATGRILAPDLARGVMLAMIVTSNTMFYLYAAEHGATGWHPVAESAPDRIAQFLMITLLDLRVYPLLAFLFGYGMMQFLQGRTRAGVDPLQARSMLRRRSFWLIVFGALHAGLLMAGDILGAYGLMSLIIGWLFLLRSDRVLMISASVALFLLFLLLALATLNFMAGQSPPAIAGAGPHGRGNRASVAEQLPGLLGSVFTAAGRLGLGIGR